MSANGSLLGYFSVATFISIWSVGVWTMIISVIVMTSIGVGGGLETPSEHGPQEKHKSYAGDPQIVNQAQRNQRQPCS